MFSLSEYRFLTIIIFDKLEKISSMVIGDILVMYVGVNNEIKLHSEHRGIYAIVFLHHVDFFSHILATPILFPWIYMKILLAMISWKMSNLR